MAKLPKGRKVSLLILQVDSDRLTADGLCLLDTANFSTLIARTALNAKTTVLTTTSKLGIDEQFRQLAQGKCLFDVVVVIGHGNENGVRAAADHFVDWTELGKMLSPFCPKKLVLITCDGGRWPTAQLLFKELPTLSRIFASPVRASKTLGTILVHLAPLILAKKVPTDDEILIAQGLIFSLTGGQLRQWIRNRDGNRSGRILDFGARLLDSVVRQNRRSL